MIEGQRTRFEKLRIAGLLVVIAGLGLLATGCNNRSSTSTTTNRQTLVRIWRVNQGNDVLKKTQQEFVKENSNVSVIYKRKKIDDYELASLKSLAARQGPDIWSMPDDWLWDHQERIVPLPDNYFFEEGKKTGPSPADEVRNRYPAGIANQLIGTDGKVYGLPTTVDVLRLYYNQDLLDQSLSEFRQNQGNNRDENAYAEARRILGKAPATWSDLLAMVPYVTQRDGDRINRATIALGSADNIPNSTEILQVLMIQNGAKITSSDRRNAYFHVPQTTAAGGTVNPGISALDFYTSFSNPAKENYTWNPSMPQAIDAFAQGKVAMVIGFSDFGELLKVKYPKFKFDSTALPQISASPLQKPVNLVRFSVETVTKTADSTGAAFAFLKTYTDAGTVHSLAREIKLTSPFKSRLEDNKNEFPQSQILNGEAVFKKNRTLFDAAFRQMILDASQNGVSSDKAILAGAETINILLAEPTDEE